MPEAARTILVEAPVEKVFAFFADPTNEMRWRPSVKEIAVQGLGPVAKGTTIHQVVKGPGGRGIAADLEVTDHQPPTLYGFRVTAGPVRPTGQYRFATQGSATSVTFSLQVHLGGLKKMLMSRSVQASMDQEMSYLDTAKTLLESR